MNSEKPRCTGLQLHKYHQQLFLHHCSCIQHQVKVFQDSRLIYSNLIIQGWSQVHSNHPDANSEYWNHLMYMMMKQNSTMTTAHSRFPWLSVDPSLNELARNKNHFQKEKRELSIKMTDIYIFTNYWPNVETSCQLTKL